MSNLLIAIAAGTAISNSNDIDGGGFLIFLTLALVFAIIIFSIREIE